jgi:hypothetical protein
MRPAVLVVCVVVGYVPVIYLSKVIAIDDEVNIYDFERLNDGRS